MSISPDLLHEALDGRSILGPGHGEGAALVRLAATVRRLQPERPSPAAVARMTTRFESLLEQPDRRGFFVLLGAWLGVGAQPRPLVQRLAAGALLFASVGGGASVASGVDPASAVENTVSFISNAIANLSPRGDSSGLSLPPVTETPAARADTSLTPSATPTPGATPTPTPTPTQSPVGASAVDNGALPAPNPDRPATSTPTPGDTPGVLSPLPTSPATATPTLKPTLTPTATATPTPTPTSPPPPPPTTDTTAIPPPPTPTTTAPPSTPTPSPSPTATVTATPTSKPGDGRGDH